LDLTANYVTRKHPLFMKAIGNDEEAKSAFVSTKTQYNNDWKKVNSDGSAWKKEGDDYFLSQFGDNFDLQMTSLVAQQTLIDALKRFIELGVKGFRLKNAKHFIINKDLKPFKILVPAVNTISRRMVRPFTRKDSAMSSATLLESFITVPVAMDS